MKEILSYVKKVSLALFKDKDVMRALIFSLMILLGVFSGDPIAYTLAIVVGTAWFSHLTRKILFPYLDMRTLVESSLEGKTSSAIVFFSVCALMGVLMICSTLLIR